MQLLSLVVPLLMGKGQLSLSSWYPAAAANPVVVYMLIFVGVMLTIMTQLSQTSLAWQIAFM